MYHPYCHNLSALTEYLKQQLRSQHAKHLSHSLPAQVEQNVSLEHNTHRVMHPKVHYNGIQKKKNIASHT